MKAKTAILISVIIVLLLTIGGLCRYISALKSNTPIDTPANDPDSASTEIPEDETPTSEENNTQPISANEDGALSDADKISINKRLADDSILIALTKIIDDYPNFGLRYGTMEYDVNLLDSPENRLTIAWELMFSDPKITRYTEGGPPRLPAEEMLNDPALLKNVLLHGPAKDIIGVTGIWCTSIDTITEYYNSIFKTPLDQDAVIKMYEDYPSIGIKDGIFYESHYSGWNGADFILKANNLVFDEKTNVYTLTIDFLTLLEKREEYGDYITNLEMLAKYSDAGILTWDSSLNYATVKLEYTKDSNGNYKLISLMFLK